MACNWSVHWYGENATCDPIPRPSIGCISTVKAPLAPPAAVPVRAYMETKSGPKPQSPKKKVCPPAPPYMGLFACPLICKNIHLRVLHSSCMGYLHNPIPHAQCLRLLVFRFVAFCHLTSCYSCTQRLFVKRLAASCCAPPYMVA